MEEASFIIQIEELLENSKLVKIESFDIPEFIFHKKCDNIREVLNRIYETLIKIYEDFCDFKIQNLKIEKLNDKL